MDETHDGLTGEQQDDLLGKLEDRFMNNRHRHPDIDWTGILKKLKADANGLLSLYKMEQTGGEPDVIEYDAAEDVYIFCDCSAETPKGRRSICYDRTALEARKKHKPVNSAIDMAAEIGIEMLTEEQYRQLQQLEDFDKKTSSWVKTPVKIRQLGGALFCDRRFDTVFTYHNGAESYYAGRGFRGFLRI